MIRVDYRLMAKGRKKGIMLFNGQFLKLDEDDNPLDAVFYSSPGYVIGVDEEACLNQIRAKLKDKYIGFRVISEDDIAKQEQVTKE